MSLVPIVELKQVYKTYYLGDTPTMAMQGVDLVVQEGEFMAIVGPSGSGKSTLCNLISLLDTPTFGSVLFQGKDVIDLSDNQRSDLRNRTIGIIFQSFNLIPVLSALENVMLPLQLRGENAGWIKRQAKQLLDGLGLAEHLDHRPQKLSGGQQQRVAIARALITHPALVIADEPTANLDSETALSMIELMGQLNQRSGATFVFSTHDQRLLDRVRRRIFLSDGRIVGNEK